MSRRSDACNCHTSRARCNHFGSKIVGGLDDCSATIHVNQPDAGNVQLRNVETVSWWEAGKGWVPCEERLFGGGLLVRTSGYLAHGGRQHETSARRILWVTKCRSNLTLGNRDPWQACLAQRKGRCGVGACAYEQVGHRSIEVRCVHIRHAVDVSKGVRVAKGRANRRPFGAGRGGGEPAPLESRDHPARGLGLLPERWR
mmetsp:Transcript_47805/g.102140  ORF Transcript_47805/g.102140 Transcript_47805/m.102140 type:complete len:200 (+) Transcript_47805:107-706(+)